MSSSILKAFFGESAWGGQTTEILLLSGLLSSNDFVISFSALCVLALSNEFRLLIEYLHSSLSSEGMGLPLPVGGFCPRPLS